MTPIGWMGGQADAEAPALPLTAQLLRMKDRGPGDALAAAMARSRAVEARQARDEAASAPDPDERAAGLVARGYMPGQISQLSMRLAETEAQLADEEAKLAKSARRAERTREMHARGQIDGFGVAARMQGTDEGDQATADRLQRRADGLRRQIAEAAEAMAGPQQRDADPLEAATSRAHAEFARVTRERMEQAAAAVPEPRPFALAGRGADADPPTPGPAYNWHPAVAPYARAELQRMIGPAEGCGDCAQYGATPAESAKIHAGAL